MMNPLRSMEESKPAMCLSPQEKLKSGGGLAAQRKKKTHAAGPLAGASEAKKQRLDDFMFKTELDLDLDGWISDDNLRAMDFDDNLRAMDFDDRLNQDIDWVAHDEIDLSLGLDFVQVHGLGAGGDDVNDFGFGPSSFLSPLRGGLAFEDPTEMASSFG
ncbi:hypothetical protein BBJ28_00014903 [Nothophytophthora sp. Chile5]|nr:hypothetical protein BBJ28_00014903 [Nothophytophthora sp. Chile5]